MDLLDFIEQLSSFETKEELFTHLVRCSTNLGFEKVAYCGLTYDDPCRCPHLRPPAIMLNYPPAWIRHYFAQQYERIDPVILYASRAPDAFEWAQLPRTLELDPAQQRLFHEAREAGLASGLTVPIHGSPSQLASVSFASSVVLRPSPKVVRSLAVVACQFHLAYCKLVSLTQANRTHLSCRETECLKWSALGKTSWEIGNILAISENTVNYHLKNAMQKLGTRTRVLAVLKAVELGLISPTPRQ
jgi:LuxR family quorum-sensing system transcriptional regulator CciR